MMEELWHRCREERKAAIQHLLRQTVKVFEQHELLRLILGCLLRLALEHQQFDHLHAL
jgi:hypothetical protein